MTPLLLGLAWGALVARPLAGRQWRRRDHRWIALRAPHRSRALAVRAERSIPGRVVRDVQQRRARARHLAGVARELPATVDLLAVAVGAGLTPALAVEAIATAAPPHAGAALALIVARTRTGSRFGDAVRTVAHDLPHLRPVADALLASERFGAPVGPALVRVAAELRSDARRRAEIHARKVPVRLLFPLVFLVLPAFGLLTIVPAVVAGFAR